MDIFRYQIIYPSKIEIQKFYDQDIYVDKKSTECNWITFLSNQVVDNHWIYSQALNVYFWNNHNYKQAFMYFVRNL